MKILSILMLSLVLICCNNSADDKSASDSAARAASADTAALELSYFGLKDIPDSLSGCAEGYSLDSAMLATNSFVLFTDLGRNGIIKVNGQLIFLHMDQRESNDDDASSTLSGQGYTIRLKSKMIRQLDDELFLEEGEMEIEKNGVKKTYKLLGNSGC